VALQGGRGIRGVFSRSPGPMGVLFALSVRALLARTLGIPDESMAVAVLTPEDGVRARLVAF
jgi:hypothetical protein